MFDTEGNTFSFPSADVTRIPTLIQIVIVRAWTERNDADECATSMNNGDALAKFVQIWVLCERCTRLHGIVKVCYVPQWYTYAYEVCAVSRSLFRTQGSPSEGKKYLHSRLIVVSSIHYQLFFPRPTMDKVTWNSIGEDNSRVFWHPNAFAQIPPWDNAHPILECT